MFGSESMQRDTGEHGRKRKSDHPPPISRGLRSAWTNTVNISPPRFWFV